MFQDRIVARNALNRDCRQNTKQNGYLKLATAIHTVPDKRIYVGIREVCDTTLQLSRGFRELGFDVTNVVMDRSHNENRPYGREGYRFHDGYIRNHNTSNNFIFFCDLTKEFLKRAPTNDVFVFTAGSSFYGNLVFKKQLRRLAYIDLPILQKLGHQVGIISNGSDLRSYKRLREEMAEAGLASHVKYFDEIYDEIIESKHIDESITKIRGSKTEQYSDVVFARPTSAQFLDEYELFWVPIDVDDIDCSVGRSTEPLIIHAPTDRATKGTKYVEEAIKRLENEGYSFRFELVTGLPNDEFRRKLTESDIVVDQLILPGYGLLALESMASGNAVLGSAVPDFNGYPKDCPLVTTTPDTVYENLRYLLENPDKRQALAERGRCYIKEHHDYLEVSKGILDGIGVEY